MHHLYISDETGISIAAEMNHCLHVQRELGCDKCLRTEFALLNGAADAGGYDALRAEALAYERGCSVLGMPNKATQLSRSHRRRRSCRSIQANSEIRRGTRRRRKR